VRITPWHKKPVSLFILGLDPIFSENLCPKNLMFKNKGVGKAYPVI